jgi:tetratricopeptide (TPR) repeat protein
MKTLFPRIAAAVLIATVLSFPAAAAESPSVLLQKGIYAEETEGNVDAAIKIYEQIAAESAANRPVVTQAQYRLAVCYQKKGNKEQAIKVLNDLVQQFPSDAAVVQKARTMLGELGAPPSEAVSIRKIPLAVDSGRFTSISPDGRFVAYVPKDGYDLAVCEISTGKVTTVAKGSKDKEPQSKPIFSPDGRWIVYDLSVAEIYVSKIDGSETRKLFEHAGKKDQVFAETWSSDGAEVGVFSWFAETEECEGFMVDAKTGARKKITLPETQGDTGYEYWNVSSDRNYLALKYRNYPSKITIWDWKLHREETVTDSGADRLFGWAPDDSKLLFSKSRPGGIDLWASRVKDGKPQGEPEIIWNNLGGVSPVGITRDGRIYYSVQKDKPASCELWVMEGFLAKKAEVAQSSLETPPEEILAPNHSILDRKFGLAFTYPENWAVNRAARFSDQAGSYIWFTAPEASAAMPRLYYLATKSGEFPSGTTAGDLKASGPKPTTTSETDIWLHKYAQLKAESRRTKDGLANYRLRPESFVSRTINGRPALSWSSDFDAKDGKKWAEYLVVIYSESLVAQFFLNSPAEEIDAVRPAFDRMAETTHLP